MATVAPGNKTHIFPSIPPNSSPSREQEIVSRTQRQMFGESPGIDNPASHYGAGGAGWQNSIAGMTNETGKDLSENYRDGLPRSRAGHDRVADR